MSYRPIEERLQGFALNPPVPRDHALLSYRSGLPERPCGGGLRRKTPSRPGLRSSSHYPLGNCVGGRFETSRSPDSTRARFLIAARRTVPGSCRRPVMTPAGGTGDICLLPIGFIRDSGERRTSCRVPFSGCPGLSQPCSQQSFRITALRLFYQGTKQPTLSAAGLLVLSCQKSRIDCTPSRPSATRLNSTALDARAVL